MPEKSIPFQIGLFTLATATSGSALAAIELEEIIVTASKRAESTQTLGLSVSAISGQDIDALGFTEFSDYAVTIPNLSFGATSDGVLSNRSIQLRGIEGLNTTGFYIDDTPISESIDPRILELERIEVLRGPQGTLYGARSLGGTVRQITRKADPDDLAGKLKVNISNTEESASTNTLLSGSFNLPITENSALLVSALFERESGIFDRAIGTIPDHLGAPATLDAEPDFIVADVDDKTTSALQTALFAMLTDNFSLDAKVIYQKTELDGFPLADIAPDNFIQNRDFNTPEGGEDEWTLYAINLNYEFEKGTFTSASSHFNRETFETEGTGSFINFLQALPAAAGGFGVFDVIGVTPVKSPIFQTLNYETTVQEFRFTSNFGGDLELVVGAFYQDTDDTENFQPRNFADGLEDNFALLQSVLAIPGPIEDIWPFGDLVFTSARPSTVEEIGLFGELTFSITDHLSAIFGSRFFDTEVTFSERQAGLAAGVPLADDAPLSSIAASTGTQSEDGANLKFGIEYEVTDSLFLYGLIAEGFRLGGANGSIPNALGCPEDLIDLGLEGTNTSSFDSDDLTSYEIGMKYDVSSSTRVNLTGFNIDFDGIQQRIQLECGFQFIGNFGAARSQGVELELLTKPTNNLVLGLNIGYTDAEFTEAVAGVVENGDALQQVPELTISGNFDYVAPDLLGEYDFFTRGTLSYVDESLSRVNSVERLRESYEQVSFRLGFENDSYTVLLFVDNLTNDIANLSDNRSLAAETPGRPRFVVSRPRTAGLGFDYRF